MEQKVKLPVRQYFKCFVECINLEETAEKEKLTQNVNNKETNLRLNYVKKCDDCIEVEFHKLMELDSSSDL